MKKPNSQAETHSNQAGPPRDFHRYTQKHTAELLDHHVAFTEASELLQFCNIYFFYLYLDYKHKHAQDPAACHVAHSKIYFFYLYIDYKHRRDRSAKPGPGAFFSLHLT